MSAGYPNSRRVGGGSQKSKCVQSLENYRSYYDGPSFICIHSFTSLFRSFDITSPAIASSKLWQYQAGLECVAFLPLPPEY